MQKNHKKICVFQKKAVLLHPLFESIPSSGPPEILISGERSNRGDPLSCNDKLRRKQVATKVP